MRTFLRELFRFCYKAAAVVLLVVGCSMVAGDLLVLGVASRWLHPRIFTRVGPSPARTGTLLLWGLTSTAAPIIAWHYFGHYASGLLILGVLPLDVWIALNCPALSGLLWYIIVNLVLGTCRRSMLAPVRAELRSHQRHISQVSRDMGRAGADQARSTRELSRLAAEKARLLERRLSWETKLTAVEASQVKEREVLDRRILELTGVEGALGCIAARQVQVAEDEVKPLESDRLTEIIRELNGSSSADSHVRLLVCQRALLNGREAFRRFDREMARIAARISEIDTCRSELSSSLKDVQRRRQTAEAEAKQESLLIEKLRVHLRTAKVTIR